MVSAVQAVFDLVDKNQDGSLSRIEIIKALRDTAESQTSPLLCKLLNLPTKIQASNDTHAAFERVYQLIDGDDSNSITRKEWTKYFHDQWLADIKSSLVHRQPPTTTGATASAPQNTGAKLEAETKANPGAESTAESAPQPILGQPYGGWRQVKQEQSGKLYFWHEATGETTWERPYAQPSTPARTPAS